LLYAIGAADTGDVESSYPFGVWRDARRIEDAIQKKNETLLTFRIIRAHWDEERFRKILAACERLRPGKGSVMERAGASTSGNLKTVIREVISYASS